MEKPEIFKPNNMFRSNNKKTFYSYTDQVDDLRSDENPNDFINNLSKEGYTFGKKVIITTKDKVYKTKIAAKMDDRVITIDNDSIFIRDIDSIKYQ